MTELAKRRRAIMAGEQMADVLYELTNQAVSVGQSIDTGIHFLSASNAGTILLDITINSNPTSSSAAGRLYRLIHMLSDNLTDFSLMLGKMTRLTNFQSTGWMNVSTGHSDYPVDAGRYKIVILHDKQSSNITVMMQYSGGQIASHTETRQYVPSNQNLHLGDPLDTARGLPSSTIHMAKIYSRVIDQVEIDDFFA